LRFYLELLLAMYSSEPEIDSSVVWLIEPFTANYARSIRSFLPFRPIPFANCLRITVVSAPLWNKIFSSRTLPFRPLNLARTTGIALFLAKTETTPGRAGVTGITFPIGGVLGALECKEGDGRMGTIRYFHTFFSSDNGCLNVNDSSTRNTILLSLVTPIVLKPCHDWAFSYTMVFFAYVTFQWDLVGLAVRCVNTASRLIFS
jgi:hypothetical protein